MLFFKECLYFPFSVIIQIINLYNREEQIVHLNSAVLFSSAIAAKISRKKIIWHIREASKIPYPVSLLIRYLSDRIVCISSIEASRFGGEDEKIKIVYNPVDLKKFNINLYNKSKIRSELGIPDDANVVISLGGVNPRKGTAEIIEAIKECTENTYAIIVGPPLIHESVNKYHQFISDLCFDDFDKKIIFTGIVENPEFYLAASDILIFIGKTPHFPRPVYEAWAMKKPVIVNEMEGISNNIENGVDGIIIKDPIEQNLAESLNILIKNPNIQKRFGIEGYKKSIIKTSPEMSAKNLESIINEII